MRTAKLWRQLIGLRHFGANEYREGYESWSEAVKASSGYSSQNILDTVLSASLEVLNGRAVFERDGVLLPRIEVSWPVAAALLWAAASDNGRLSVCDVGGSLGSNYRQNIGFIGDLPDLKWNVLEQKNFCDAGRKYFSNAQLRFFESVAFQESDANAILVSGALQYLPEPFEMLQSLSTTRAKVLILDRVPTTSMPVDCIAVQMVPPRIYEASYPVRLFSAEKLLHDVNCLGWTLHDSFPALDRTESTSRGTKVKFRGYIFRR